MSVWQCRMAAERGAHTSRAQHLVGYHMPDKRAQLKECDSKVTPMFLPMGRCKFVKLFTIGFEGPAIASARARCRWYHVAVMQWTPNQHTEHGHAMAA